MNSLISAAWFLATAMGAPRGAAGGKLELAKSRDGALAAIYSALSAPSASVST